jgi:DNA replication protein DnaC
MSTVVPSQVSATELKLRQKVTEQREKEAAKGQESRVKEAQKAINKMAATKLSLDCLINKSDFAMLPDMVRVQLMRLSERLEAIQHTCTAIVVSGGSGEGDIATLQDTIHT